MADSWKEKVSELRKQKGNEFCADCGVKEPDWCVYNLGVFVCIDCAGIHRQLGVHISKVKSATLDTWNDEQIQMVKSKGNTQMKQIYEAYLPKWHMTPKDNPVAEYRKWFIQQKYADKKWMRNDDEKRDSNAPSGFMKAPGRLCIATFYHEATKKKAIFQLLGEFLHYFRSAEDSFSFEKYNVRNLKSSIQGSGTEHILVIETSNETLFRVQSMSSNMMELVDFAHQLRQGRAFYSSQYASEGKALSPESPGLEKITTEQLKEGKVLGLASKKGGGVHGYKRRWWVLHKGFLYYFKEDFRTNKKSPNEGKPQGFVGLHGADVAWDKDRKRTGKQNAFLLATYDRTFYIVTNNNNKDEFYQAMEAECLRLWPRANINFSQL